MKLYSFAYHEGRYIPVEISLTLVGGLSVVQFTGAVDSVLKDSIPRIKSAIRRSGSDWPQNSQILIQIRPSNFKKVSFGLDLALAAAILIETGQIEGFDEETHFYAELGFNGEVIIPEGLTQLPAVENLLTAATSEQLLFPSLGLSQLKTLSNKKFISNPVRRIESTRPTLPEMQFTALAARHLQLIAVGEHPVMLAGPAGSGKSTFSESLYYLQSDPDVPFEGWRPKVQPHHSIPMRSFIGGGYPLVPGELSRSHQGLLILDEYLEFSKHVQESLRGPLGQGQIELSRRGQVQTYPCRMQLVATTNLCPCGDLSPSNGKICGYALHKCRSVVERLSGPVLDRFDMLLLSDHWQGPRQTSLSEVLHKVEEARQWRKESDRKPACCYTVDQLEKQMDAFTVQNLMPIVLGSERRKRALLRVARSAADLEKSEKIQGHHLQEAIGPCIGHFTEVKTLFA